MGGPPIFCGRLEGIHRRAIVVTELFDVFRRRSIEAKNESVRSARNIFRGNSRGSESFGDMALDAPGHGANKAFWRWRRVRRADLQNLRDQCWVVRDPISHENG